MGCNTSKESVPQNEAGQNNENRETEEKSNKEGQFLLITYILLKMYLFVFSIF